MMSMTAAPVAATKPHAFSPAHETACSQPAKPQDEATRIGEMLAKLVRDGNVRSMEALAVVVIASDWGRICAAAAMPAAETDAKTAEIQAGERVTRRAIAGVLEDHSGGAKRFHRIGDLPDWARENRPVAHLGEFLFYRI